jgi:hypothetical protein
VVRVDPATGTAVDKVILPRTPAQFPYQVAVGAGAVWVSSATTELGTPSELWRVAPATNRITRSLLLGVATPPLVPHAVAVGDGALWMTNGDGRAVLRPEPTP